MAAKQSKKPIASIFVPANEPDKKIPVIDLDPGKFGKAAFKFGYSKAKLAVKWNAELVKFIAYCEAEGLVPVAKPKAKAEPATANVISLD